LIHPTETQQEVFPNMRGFAGVKKYYREQTLAMMSTVLAKD
jgi:hypothetical protein